MLDIKFIRENSDKVREAIKQKRDHADLDKLLKLDEERRALVQKADNLKAERNRVSDQIATLKKSGQDASEDILKMRDVSEQIKQLDEGLRSAESGIHEIQMQIPNIPHESVPIGTSERDNVLVREWGKKPTFDFEPRAHWDLGPELEVVDFERASRLSGSNFVSFSGAGATLVRSLINFMIDLHVRKHGYKEVWVPIILRREMMEGTGQLPKLEEDMYRIEKDDLFMIPTAEVPITNLHRDEIFDVEKLPIKYTGYTPCFRREAGSYGADTRGLMRIHQFDKVEMVKFVRAETSYDELELLVQNAEEILQIFNLPYRVMTLATGDLSFAAAKCYDIEVYAPGIDRWLEVSSCSNFEDFQARRMNIRYRPDKSAKPQFVHTLNGSGLALPRLLIALIETYQTAEGTIIIPEPLRPYVGLDVIK
ncbi:serine--tRNA ligase [candidate division KSB1 bacterium]|nr:serine--tRNA ligase [candidate division KSB1 bacterium]